MFAIPFRYQANKEIKNIKEDFSKNESALQLRGICNYAYPFFIMFLYAKSFTYALSIIFKMSQALASL
ncbi:hypothetical protein bcere0023_2220 [Bacillus cereus Rock4-2]|nr:hypothetical protein bcere0023_2220 [Bacillus cereus Rock4-2]